MKPLDVTNPRDTRYTSGMVGDTLSYSIQTRSDKQVQLGLFQEKLRSVYDNIQNLNEQIATKEDPAILSEMQNQLDKLQKQAKMLEDSIQNLQDKIESEIKAKEASAKYVAARLAQKRELDANGKKVHC